MPIDPLCAYTSRTLIPELKLPLQIISVTPSKLRKNDGVHVVAAGFPGGARIELVIGRPGSDLTPALVVPGVADANGNANFEFVMPDATAMVQIVPGAPPDPCVAVGVGMIDGGGGTGVPVPYVD